MFVLPLISSMFSGGSTSSGTPHVVYDNPQPPYTELRTTPRYDIKFYVKPSDVVNFSPSKLNTLDRTAEQNFLRYLRSECENEMMYKQRLRDAATGWFYQDPVRMATADAVPTRSCDRLDAMGLNR
jgi:DnaJ family protein B protein 12